LVDSIAAIINHEKQQEEDKKYGTEWDLLTVLEIKKRMTGLGFKFLI
jgi:arabinogalactan endo-1,4-beta-galactosidase